MRHTAPANAFAQPRYEILRNTAPATGKARGRLTGTRTRLPPHFAPFLVRFGVTHHGLEVLAIAVRKIFDEAAAAVVSQSDGHEIGLYRQRFTGCTSTQQFRIVLCAE